MLLGVFWIVLGHPLLSLSLAFISLVVCCLLPRVGTPTLFKLIGVVQAARRPALFLSIGFIVLSFLFSPLLFSAFNCATVFELHDL